MAKNQVRMPSSGAGITQYYEQEQTKFTLEPTQATAIIIAVVILILVLHFIGGSFL